MDTDKFISILELILENQKEFFPCFLLSGIEQLGKEGRLCKNSVLKIHNVIFKYSFSSDGLMDPLIKKSISFLKNECIEKSNLVLQPPRSDNFGNSILSEAVQNQQELNAHFSGNSSTSTLVENNVEFRNAPSSNVCNEEVQTGKGNYINIISKEIHHFKKFRMDGVKMIFQLKDSSHQDINNLIEWMEIAFTEMIKEIILNSNEKSKVTLSLSLLNNPEVKPIWISMRPVDQLDGKLIVNLISDVNQSNSVFFSNEILQVEANIVNFPFGGGKYDKIGNEKEYLKNKRSVIDVSKNGFECLPKCICYGMNMEKEKVSEKSLCILSKALCKNASVVITKNKGCLISDIYKFQKFLKDFQIVVFSSLKGDILFQGLAQFKRGKKIYLYFSESENHFYVIKSLTGFFNKNYLCLFCDSVYNNKFYHKCEMRCQYCFTSPPCLFVQSVKNCTICNRSFRGEVCYNNHLTNVIDKDTVCNTMKVCQDCGKFINKSIRSEEHVCGEFFCTNCFKYVSSDHLCFMKLYRKRKNPNFFFVFFIAKALKIYIINLSLIPLYTQ